LLVSVILCGSHPFFHSCTPVMFNLIRRADFTFSSPVWDHISNDAKVGTVVPTQMYRLLGVALLELPVWPCLYDGLKP
jgi:hypothetical protein